MLDEAGVIERYVTLLDPAKLKLGLTVFAWVWLRGQDQDTVDRFTAAILALPRGEECHLMTGDCDFLLWIVTRDLDDYRRFPMEHLGRIESVQQIRTEVSMQPIKRTTKLPL